MWLCSVLLLLAPANAKSEAAIPFVQPVKAACISSPFGPRHIANRPSLNTFHNGIDLPAAAGSPVLAVAPGVIVRVQRKGPGGLEILIRHNGFVGIYSHLGLIAPAIAEGGRLVQGGQKIGTVGLSGKTFGPHLFFAMIVGSRAVDPAPYLSVLPCGRDGAGGIDAKLPPSRPDSLRYDTGLVSRVRNPAHQGFANCTSYDSA